MRVIAGTARRLLLKTPQGLETRPTSDIIKETLFNMLMPYLPGAVVVDLFAGSGGIGIEALSRGARKAYFVENSPKAIACITDNLKHTHLEDKSVVLKQDVFAALYGSIRDKADIVFLDPPYFQDVFAALYGSIRDKADIVFLDPPYFQGFEKRVLEILQNMPYITEESRVIVEASNQTMFDDVSGLGFDVEKEKIYKTNKHVFLRKKGTCL